MSNRRKNSHSFSVQSSKLPHQCERVQQQTDLYTQRFEWQKKNNHIKSITLRNLDDEISKVQSNINRLNQQKQDGRHKKMDHKFKSLYKQLDSLHKKINQQVGDIKSLTSQVDLVREQKARFIQNIKSCQLQIEGNKQEMQRLQEQCEKIQQQEKLIDDSIFNSKKQNQKEKDFFYGKMIGLNKNKQQKASAQKTGTNLQFIQNQTLAALKNRVLKVIVNNKQKVKLIQKYQKSMKSIDNAFNIIKQTTGITDIQQIKNTFIKGQQQNYGLLTYVDVLSQQIQHLNSQNDELRKRNTSIQLQNQLKKQSLNAMPQQQRKSIQLKKACQSKRTVIKQFSQMLSRIQPHCQNCLNALSQCSFGNKKFNSEGFSLITTNVNEYFSEIDTILTPILLNMAQQNNKDNLLKQMLLLQEIPKNDSKKVSANYFPAGDQDVPRGQLLDIKRLREIAQAELKKRDIKPKKL